MEDSIQDEATIKAPLSAMLKLLYGLLHFGISSGAAIGLSFAIILLACFFLMKFI